MSETDLPERVSAALRDARKPVSFKALAKLLKAKEEPLRQALETAKAHRWPGRTEPFWSVSAEQKAREAILQTAEVQAFSKAELSKKAAKLAFGIPAKQMESYVSVLLAEKELRAVPAFSGSAKLLVRRDGQQAYFKAAREFIEKKILKAEFQPSAFFEKDSASTNAAEEILEAVKSLEPVRGVPVSTLRLRNHFAKMSKREFDEAALELRQRQQVILSLHADPHNLGQEEKESLIEGHDGTYYVAVAIR
jgi:hypothetical protein